MVGRAEERAEELRRRLQEDEHRHDVLEHPQISRWEAGQLLRELEALESEGVERTPDSPTHRLGGPARASFSVLAHRRPWEDPVALRSVAELRTYHHKAAAFEGEDATYLAMATVQDVQVVLTYEHGLLTRALLRGDGRRGEDVTDNVRTIRSVPLRLRPAGSVTESRVTKLTREAFGPATLSPVPAFPPELHVRVGVALRSSDLTALDRRRVDAGEPPYVQARGAVMGSLRRLDPKVSASRPLRAFAIGCDETPQGIDTSWQLFGALKSWGFAIQPITWRCKGLQELLDFVAELQQIAPSSEYALDGGLLVLNRLGVRAGDLPSTVRLSFPPPGRLAAVQKIYQAVGRAGTLLPVAALQRAPGSDMTVPERAPVPVVGSGAFLSLEAGSAVRVRPGSVAPVLLAEGPPIAARPPPERCPGCTGPLRAAADEPFSVCDNERCLGRVRARLLHFAGPRGLRLSSLSPKVIDKLITELSVADALDLLALDRAKVERVAPGQGALFEDEIGKGRRMPLWRFLYLLAIPHVSERAARILAYHLHAMSRLEELRPEDCARIPDVPPEAASGLARWIAGPGRRAILRARQLGLVIQDGAETFPAPLLGRTVVIAGEFESGLAHAIDEAERRGARVLARVGRTTELLIAGAKAEKEFDTAAMYGIPVIDEGAFGSLLRIRALVEALNFRAVLRRAPAVDRLLCAGSNGKDGLVEMVGWPPPTAKGEAGRVTAERPAWATMISAACTAGALVIAGSFFLLWLAPGPLSRATASFGMKTNTALAILLAGFGVWSRTSSRPSRGWRRLGTAAVSLAMALAAATLAQDVFGVDLGIDELIARDPYIEEADLEPNRMSPVAAASLIVLGLAVFAAGSRAPRVAAFGQVLDLVLLGICLVTLLGYLFEVQVFYRPTPFIRVSPYAMTAMGLLGIALLASRADLGIGRILSSPGLAGYLSRRLMIIALIVPIASSWLLVELERMAVVDAAMGAPYLVLAVVFSSVALVFVLARSLDGIDARRLKTERDLRRYAEITSALSRAGTVDEVTHAMIEEGLPAVGAVSGSVFLLAEDGSALHLTRSAGFTHEELAGYRSIPVGAASPIAEALAQTEPVYLASSEALAVRYPALAGVRRHRAWVALRLQGRERPLGVLGLAFATPQRFDKPARDLLQLLAWHSSQALDRALLFDSERAARRETAAASRAKDEFLAMLGHELRNPLSPILTSLEVMRLRGGGPFDKERKVIERQVGHMTRLVDDLLDVSRITRGKVELRPRLVELGTIVREAVELTSPILEQRRHHLKIDVLPVGLLVHVDQQRLVQVVANLLTNAAKYTDPGGHIEIHATSDGGEVHLRVVDDGVGIPEELLPHVFDLFTQGDRTIDRAKGGLGLGLSIVRSLVEAQHGRVWAQSAGVGKGSAFTVTLPLAISAAYTPLPEEIGEAAPGLRRRILVVDDNTDAAETLAEVLRVSGHEVQVAFDGPTGLDVAARFRPSVVFLDLGLPVMDGFEVARTLRRSPDLASVKIVAVTGYGQDSDREKTKEVGFDHHLVKPVAVDEVLAIAGGDG